MILSQNLAYTLPPDAQYDLIRTFTAILPPPPDPDPDAGARRNNALITRIAALQPANSAETDLAANFVLANELCRDAVRLSGDPNLPLPMFLKCRAQAASMMRAANSAVRELRRMKAERREIEADPEACDRAERAEHITTVLLAEGLANPPAPARLTECAEPDQRPTVSPHDPESRESKTETPARLEPPATTTTTTRGPVSPRDPETRKNKTETPARLATPATATTTRDPVSSKDPETRKHKTETPVRLQHPIELPPDHPDANLVGAWRLAHLYPARDPEPAPD